MATTKNKKEKTEDEVDALLKKAVEEIDVLYKSMLVRRREFLTMRLALPVVKELETLMGSLLAKKTDLHRLRRELRERVPNMTPLRSDSQAELAAQREGAAAFEAQVADAIKDRHSAEAETVNDGIPYSGGHRPSSDEAEAQKRRGR